MKAYADYNDYEIVGEYEDAGKSGKSIEGRWNGGFAPYGYQLVDGKLIINEEEAEAIRLILKNPVYCGKIAYGRRKTEKVRGTRNEYKLVEQDNYLLADGFYH